MHARRGRLRRLTAVLVVGALIGGAAAALPAAASAVGVENLVLNGDIAATTDHWWSSAGSLTTEDGALRADFPASTNPWEVIVGQGGVALVAGTEYSFSAKVRADRTGITLRTQVAPTTPNATFSTYTAIETPLTADWQEVTATFTAEDFGQGTASDVQFRLGGNAAGTFWLDDVSIVATGTGGGDGGGTGPTEPTEPTVGTDQLLPNPTFATGTSPWWTAGAVTLSNPDQQMCATIGADTANVWDLLLGHNDIPMPGDTAFRLSFTASAVAPGGSPATLNASTQVGTYSGPDQVSWLQKSFELTATPTTQAFTFTTTAVDTFHLGQIQFRIGGMPSGTVVCVDDVTLTGTKYTYRADTGPAVKVNQVGYLTRGPKRATVVTEATTPLEWSLQAPGGAVVATGTTTPAGLDPSAGTNVHTVDFSGVQAPGAGYTLHVGDQQSFPFTISDDVFQSLRADSLRFFYTNRSGIAIDGAIAGAEYARPAGHLGVAPNQGDTDVACLEPQTWSDGWTCTDRHDVSGGWYDAGDHGKYVVNGGIAVAQLLSAWERAKAAGTTASLADGTLAVPEHGNGVPDILDEARWELEWMLKMQVPAGDPLAGMAWHKVTDRNWTGLPLLPDQDPQERLLHRPSTAATLNLAAVAAQGSRLFAEFDPAFAARLLTAAETAYEAARTNPVLLAPAEDGTGGGTYDDDDVTDEFYWAAAELYLTTGAGDYRTDVETNPLHLAMNTDVDIFTAGGFFWGDVAALARMQLARFGADLPDIAQIRQSVVDAADALIADQKAQPFGQPYAPKEGLYDWGSNSAVLNNQVVIATAFDLTHRPRYADAVIEGYDYLFGRNVLAQSYVTGYGTKYSQNQHSRWYAHALDPSLPHPPKGTVAGGPNSSIQDPVAGAWLQGCAAQACYVDDIGAWSVNEITVNWNSALAWVASFVGDLGDGYVAVTPIARPDTASGPAGAPISIAPLANDEPGDPDVPFDPATLTLAESEEFETFARASVTAADAGIVRRITVTGGRYDLVGDRIVFTPDAGYTGSPAPVTYRVADTRGTVVSSTFAPTVTAVVDGGTDPGAGTGTAGTATGTTGTSAALASTGGDARPWTALAGIAALLIAAGAVLLRRRRA